MLNIKLGLGLIGIGRQWGYANIQVPPESDVLAFLKDAFDLGVDYFDTAASYGSSEARFGKFLRTLTVEERNRITISTKFGDHWDEEKQDAYVDHSFDALRKSLDRSISCLGKIDILQLHKTNPQVLKSDDLKRSLDYARSKGITVFGASVSDVESGQMVCESDVFTVIQCPYNIENPKFDDVIDLAKKTNKLVLTNRPFGMGKMLYNDAQERSDKTKRMIEAYTFILKKKFRGFILSGTKSISHLKDNMEAFQIAAKNIN